MVDDDEDVEVGDAPEGRVEDVYDVVKVYYRCVVLMEDQISDGEGVGAGVTWLALS